MFLVTERTARSLFCFERWTLPLHRHVSEPSIFISDVIGLRLYNLLEREVDYSPWCFILLLWLLARQKETDFIETKMHPAKRIFKTQFKNEVDGFYKGMESTLY
jgi:hypothetical protein